MAKKTPKANMQKLQAKEQRQEKTIERYKKQAQWITWAVIAILLLILFFVLSMGYASNWWQNPTRTSQFNPLGTDASQQAGTDAQTTGNIGTTNTGTDTTSRTGTSSTNNTTRETTSVTNNNTTITTPAPPAPTPQPSQRLLTLNSNISTGENIDEIIGLANNLGVGVNCRIELLVRVCDFTDGQFTITTKNLITGGGITGINLNF